MRPQKQTLKYSNPLSTKKNTSTASGGGLLIHLFVYLINPSLFTVSRQSRLKMNLLYTRSPVKGHSVQCGWCLQCIYTRYVTGWVRSRRPWPRWGFPAASSQSRSSASRFCALRGQTPVQVRLRLATMKAVWSAPADFWQERKASQISINGAAALCK